MPAIRTTRNSTAGSAGPSEDPARPARVTEAEKAPKEDATYNTGDFTITAGRPEDRVVFRLPSFFMLAASVVIRDTFAIGATGGKFELDLPNDAVPVKIWLNLVTGKSLPPLADRTVARFRRVLELCQQFDCAWVASVVMSGIEEMIDDQSVSAVDIIITCSEFDGSRQFAKCIGEKGGKSFSKFRRSSDPESLRALGSASIRDPASWPLYDFCKLPPAYAWSLLRSYRTTDSLYEQTEELKSLFATIENHRNASAAPESTLGTSGEGSS